MEVWVGVGVRGRVAEEVGPDEVVLEEVVVGLRRALIAAILVVV